jgi:hypothetical protein
VPKYDALLTCFSTPRMALQPGDVAVERAMSYDPSGLETVISADLLPTVDTLTIPDALANDPYFASSYRLRPSSLSFGACVPASHRAAAHLIESAVALGGAGTGRSDTTISGAQTAVSWSWSRGMARGTPHSRARQPTTA